MKKNPATRAHACPELCLGSRENSEKANYLIEKLFEKEIISNEELPKEFYFYTDRKGDYC